MTIRQPACLLLALLTTLLFPGCGDGARTDCLTISPAKVDFGRILKGAKVVRTIVLRNGGSSQVAVVGTEFNCKCFSVHPFQRMLQPGEEQEVKLTFDSWLIAPSPMRGKLFKIHSNDWLHPTLEVPLEGEVIASVITEPELLALGRLTPGLERVIKIRPGPGMEMKLSSWRITRQDVLEATIAENPTDGGHDVTIRVREGAEGRGLFSAALEAKVEVEGQGFERMSRTRIVPIQGEWPN